MALKCYLFRIRSARPSDSIIHGIVHGNVWWLLMLLNIKAVLWMIFTKKLICNRKYYLHFYILIYKNKKMCLVKRSNLKLLVIIASIEYRTQHHRSLRSDCVNKQYIFLQHCEFHPYPYWYRNQLNLFHSLIASRFCCRTNSVTITAVDIINWSPHFVIPTYMGKTFVGFGLYDEPTRLVTLICILAT